MHGSAEEYQAQSIWVIQSTASVWMPLLIYFRSPTHFTQTFGQGALNPRSRQLTMWRSVMKFEAEVCAMASTMLTEADDSKFICQLNNQPSQVPACLPACSLV